MINPQWLELSISRTNFHGPKDVRAIEVIEVRLYLDMDAKSLSRRHQEVHEHCILCSSNILITWRTS